MKSSVNGDKKEEVKKETKVSPDTDLFQMVKDLQSEINSLKADKKTVVSPEENEGVIPADDFLDDPVVFFAYSTSFALQGDLRRGKRIQAPDGEMVKFRRAYRYEKRSSNRRGVDMVSTCSVRVQSKTLAEWMRGHRLFGSKFFENMRDAENVDVTFAEKMSQVQGLIDSMSDMQVIERAKSMTGINVNTMNVDKVRKQVVERTAKIEIEAESKRKVKSYVDGQGKVDAKIDETKIQKGNLQGDVY